MSQPQTTPENSPSDPNYQMAFVGRQPIFDTKKEVVAYELLFRSGSANANMAGQGDEVTTTVMNNSLSLIGLDTLTGGKKAFVNMTRGLLLSGDYCVLPSESTVIELLENVRPDPEVIAACRKLKSAGYTLALDDLTSTEGYEPLLELADIIKVDFMGVDPSERGMLAQSLSAYDAMLLAEKVETHEEFEEAVQQGYGMLQGYFLSKPQIIAAKDVPGMKHVQIQLLIEVNRPGIDFDKLEDLVKTDVSLSSKLLRYLNSASFGVRNKISSVKQALVMLGIQPVKKWATLVCMSNISQDKPDELMITSLVRARFCENLAEDAGLKNRQFDAFMMGMLSILDVLMGRPIDELLEPMPLANDVKATLTGEQTALTDLYQLAVSCEQVDGTHVTEFADRAHLDICRVYETYRESLVWADQVQAAA